MHKTSIDSPAFWTDNCTGPCLPPLYFLAWTGTDAAHHVNYVAPAIATTKVTMPETSIAHPAAVSGGDLNDIIAWTGTDSLHHLNIECVRGCGAVTHVKLTLPETSGRGPALVRDGAFGALLAWTGTNTNHSLNVLRLDIAGTQNQEHWVIGKKVILSSTAASQAQA